MEKDKKVRVIKAKARPEETGFIPDNAIPEESRAEAFSQSKRSAHTAEAIRRVIDAMPGLISYIDTEYRYKFANRGYLEWFGLEEAQIAGVSMSEVLGESAFAALKPFVDGAIGGQAQEFESDVPYRTGGTRSVRATYTPDIEDEIVRGFYVNVVDISETREAQQALAESEERYRAFLERSTEGIWRAELERPIPVGLSVDEQVKMMFAYGYMAECNDAMARQYGFAKAGELVGTRIDQMLVPDDPDNVEYLKAFVESGYNLSEAESHERDVNGNDRYFLNNLVGIVEDGNVVRAWGTQRDVTATKNAHILTARLAAIVTSSDDAIISKDLDGIITSWNDAAERMFQYSADEAIGRPITILIPPDRLGEEADIISRIRKGENVDHIETLRRRKDGVDLDISVTVSPIRDDAGNIIGASKVARDITEKRRAQETLDQNQLMLTLAMQSSRMGAWERDIAADMIWWSEELEEIFGLDPGEFRGTEEHYYELIHEDDREATRAIVRNAVAEHQTYVMEFRFHHADGSIRWMEGRGQAVYSQKGEPVRLYGVGIDITERKKSDGALRESEERLRLAVDISQTGTFEIDLFTDAVKTDAIGRKIYGWESDAQMTFAEVQAQFHPDDREYVMRTVSAAFAPEGSDQFELEQRIIRTDGETRWIRVYGRAFFEGDGDTRRAVRCLGTYIDITEQKQSEESLRESDERFRLALSSGAVTVYEQDADLRYKWVFPEGPYRDDVIGKTDEELSPGDDAEVRNDLKRRVMRTGKNLRAEVAANVKGVRHWYDLLIEPRLDGEGNVIGIGGTALDITERRELEQSYLQSEQHFRALMEQAPFSIQLFSPDGRTVRVNRAWEDLWGATLEKLGDYNVLDDPQLEAKGISPYIRQAFAGEAAELPAIQYNPNETISGLSSLEDPRLWVTAVAYPLIGPDGEIREVALIHQDITKRVLAEEKITYQKRLLEALTESVLDGILIVSPSGEMLHFNQQFLDIWNFPPEIIGAKSDSLALDWAAHQTLDPAAFIARVTDIYEQPNIDFREEMPMKDGRVYERFGAPIYEGETRLGWVWTFRDITERKRAEKIIHDSEERMRVAMNAARMYSWEIDIETRKTIISTDAAEVLGFERITNPTDVELQISTIIHPDDRARLAEALQQAYVTGELHEQMRFVDPQSGQVVWAETQGTASRDETGRPFKIFGVTQNITERKHAEDALTESEERFRNVFESIDEGFVVVDMIFDDNGKPVDYRFIQANPAFARLTKLENSIGRTAREMAPGLEEFWFEIYGRVAMTGEAVRFENYAEPMGRWFNVYASRVGDKASKRVAIVFENITNRKEVEMALRVSEERYRAVVESQSEMLCRFRIDGKILFVNQAYASAVGATQDELMNGSFWDFIPDEDQVGVREMLTSLTPDDPQIQIENRFETKDGIRWTLWTNRALAFDEAGNPHEAQSTGIDITERRAAEGKVRESEARFRNMADNAPVMIWVTNADGYCNYLSQTWYDLTGQTPETGLGYGWLDATHPDDKTIAEATFVSANSKCEPFRVEYRLRNKDGEYLWAIDSAQPRFSESGVFLGYIGSVIDIDDRKKAEVQMLRDRERFDIVRDAAQVGFWFCDLPFDKLTWDNRVKEHFWLEPDAEVTIGTFYDQMHPDDREPTRLAIEASIANKTRYEIEYRTVSPTGQDKWIRAIGRTFYAESGDPVRFDGVTLDITQRKLDEEALITAERKAAEEYQQLLERIVPLAETLGRARDLVTVFRKVGEFIRKSMPCSALFVSFYDPQTALRTAAYGWGDGGEIDISQLPPIELTEDGGPNSQAVFEQRTVIVNNYMESMRSRPHVIINKSGVDPMSAVAVPMIVMDRVIGTFEVQSYENDAFAAEHVIALEMAANLAAVAVENVRLIEVEAQARSEAEAANRAKDEFLSVLSHELRTPLNAMLGWVRMLRTGMLDADSSTKALEVIERNTRLQGSLIEDLLDVSRIISGKMRIETEAIDLIAVVKTVSETIGPLAIAKDVKYTIDASDETLFLNADPVRLQQVISNLAQNAIKFTPEGGTVTIGARRDGSEAVLSVTDTGIGIEAEFLPYIFDRFRQADASTRRNYTGLGLGLTIARTIVSLHGGKIDVTSNGRDRGSVFTVRLPLAVEFYSVLAEEELSLIGGTGSALEGMRILLVDDDAESTLPLRLFLEGEKAQIDSVTNAEDALDRLKSGGFNLIISDIGMPGTDGFELIQMIRQSKNGESQIPAIALTAYASEDDREKTMSAGFQHHFSKPVNFDELLKILESFTGL